MPPKKKKAKHSPPGDVQTVPGLSVAKGSDGEGSDSSASSLDSIMVIYVHDNNIIMESVYTV